MFFHFCPLQLSTSDFKRGPYLVNHNALTGFGDRPIKWHTLTLDKAVLEFKVSLLQILIRVQQHETIDI